MNREGNVYYSCNGIKKHITSFCHGNLTTKKRKTEKNMTELLIKWTQRETCIHSVLVKKKRERRVSPFCNCKKYKENRNRMNIWRSCLQNEYREKHVLFYHVTVENRRKKSVWLQFVMVLSTQKRKRERIWRSCLQDEERETYIISFCDGKKKYITSFSDGNKYKDIARIKKKK